jgi:F-box protein 18 (helicase)
MIQLTEEQKDIISCDRVQGEILKIMAFAGTGKTSTLIEYTKSRPHMRFLYVAFNKSVQLAATEKFPRNVVTKTSHALAFQTIGYKHKDRLVSKFRANTVLDVFGLKKFEDAKFTIDALYNYLISAATKF